jgi:hypothetical protein
VKRHSRSGKVRGTLPPHTREPVACISWIFQVVLAHLLYTILIFPVVLRALLMTPVCYKSDLKLRNLRALRSLSLSQSRLDYGMGGWSTPELRCFGGCCPFSPDTQCVPVMPTRLACVQGKLIQRPSRWKLLAELPPKLQRLQGDVCGPIAPALGLFRYFLVLVDVAGVYFEVSLLSTRNMVFSKILAMLIKFRTHYPDSPI